MLSDAHETSNGALIIRRVTTEDAGVYKCIATGAYSITEGELELFVIGLSFSLFYLSSFTVTVAAKDKIITVQNNRTIYLSNLTRGTCKFLIPF